MSIYGKQVADFSQYKLIYSIMSTRLVCNMKSLLANQRKRKAVSFFFS